MSHQFSKFGPIALFFARPIAIAGSAIGNSIIRIEWITLINSLATQAYFLIDVGGGIRYSMGLLPLESIHISFPESSPLIVGGSAALITLFASSTPFANTPFIVTQLGVTLQYRVAA